MIKRRVWGLVTALFVVSTVCSPIQAQNAYVSWSTFDAGFDVPSVPDIRLTSVVGQSFAGTSRNATITLQSGFLSRGQPERSLGVEENGRPELPLTNMLYQNYPNPFNPLTTIKYTVGGVRDQGAGLSKTRLIVYDVLGREVAVLVNEVKQPGDYRVRFDGSGLASGAYFYRLTAGDFVSTKRLMLVK